MADPYSADIYTLGKLLTRENQPLKVPLYQRPYTWRTSEVKDFWDDLASFAEGATPAKREDQYFLGSVVVVDRSHHLELLDGQQRMATTTILLATVRAYLEKEGNQWGKEATKLGRYLADEEFGEDEVTYRLELSRQDKVFFRERVQSWDGKKKVDASKFPSHKRINAAYNFLNRSVKDLGEEKGPEHVLKVARIVVSNVSLVVCESTEYDTAASVFETLNSRGIALSTADLLRTWLLGQAKSDSERDDIASAWEPIFAMHEDANADDFIRHYWLSHRGDVKGRKLYREISDWIKKHSITAVEFSVSLEAAAWVYQDLASASEKDGELKRGLEAVRALGAKALMPALLSAWEVIDPKDVASRRRLLSAFVSLYVRHILIGGRDNSELEQTMFAIAVGLRDSMSVDLAIQKVNAILPDDETFQRDFATAPIARRVSAAYVLRELEQASRPTKELRVATPDLVHVEHIYPQTPKKGQKWKDHDDWVGRIGNLTPLAAPINSALQNSGFETKRPEYDTSELMITKALTHYPEWTPTTITESRCS